MSDRLRVLVWMARPAVILLFGLFAATGVAQAGAAGDPAPLFGALVVVGGFLVCAVAVNDLSDEAIDRVNLPGDPGRPLVVGACGRRALGVAGVTAGGAALGASLLLEGPAVVVVACGLALGLAYSVRPVRLADRGLVAALALPAAYVAVPYLVGIFSVRASLRPPDLLLLGGLYVGFVGRILLKDFRDVRGDALFGKRTFLVRHGRARTCAASAACWVGGSAMLFGVRGVTPVLAAAYTLLVAAALALLRARGRGAPGRTPRLRARHRGPRDHRGGPGPPVDDRSPVGRPGRRGGDGGHRRGRRRAGLDDGRPGACAAPRGSPGLGPRAG